MPVIGGRERKSACHLVPVFRAFVGKLSVRRPLRHSWRLLRLERRLVTTVERSWPPLSTGGSPARGLEERRLSAERTPCWAALGSALRAVQAPLAFVFLTALRVAAPPCAGGWTGRVGSVQQRGAAAAGPRGLRSHSLAGVCRTGAPSLGTRERSFPEPGSPALGLGSAPLFLRGLWWRVVGALGCVCAHFGLSVASGGPGLPHRTVSAPRHVCADGWPFTDFGGLVGAPVCAPTASSWGSLVAPGLCMAPSRCCVYRWLVFYRPLVACNSCS